MDQVRPQNPKRRRTDDRAPEMGRPAPHQTPSGGGPAPTPDRSKTPAAGSALIGVDNQRPVTEGIFAPPLSTISGPERLQLGPVTAKLCKMASASGTTQNQRVGIGSVLAAGHALRRTIRYGIAGRPARAPGFSLLDVGDHDRKHVRELGGRFAQLRGHWARLALARSWIRRCYASCNMLTAL